MNQSHYNQIEIVEKLDIKAYLLRFWESEFEIIEPIISDAGVKLYTPKDFTILNRVKELLITEKHSLYKAKSILEREFSSFDSQYITTEEDSYVEETSQDYDIQEESSIDEPIEELVVTLNSHETIEDKVQDIQTEEVNTANNSESLVAPLVEKKDAPEVTTLESKEDVAPVVIQEKAVEIKVVDYSLLDKAMELLATTKNSISTFKNKLEI